MDKLKGKLSSLGLGNKEAQKSEPERERGVLDMDTARSCSKKEKFQELKGKEQEAFFRYLRGGKYPEKEDICSVDPGILKGSSRKYQFWLKCEKIELVDLFQVYICTDDDDKRLQEVEECVSEGDMEEELKEKEKDAKKTEDFINALKHKMEHKLQGKFNGFREMIEINDAYKIKQ